MVVNTYIFSDYGPDMSTSISVHELGLRAVFQLSLDTASLPSDWRNANISSVYKKGDKHLAENYRPIVYAIKSLLLRRTLPDPAETGSNNPHYRSGEGGFGGIHSMD